MSRMMTRSLTASSRSLTASSAASQPPSEAGSRASVYTIPPPTTPEDKRDVANAAAHAHADMSRASAAAADLAPSRPGPREDVDGAPSTCSTPSVSTPEKTLREYQSSIVSKCERANTLVVLPTGAGKTIVAGEVIKRKPPPALFLVPSRHLVEQQAKTLRSWTRLNVVLCKGGDELPKKPFDVLVATPDAFRAAREKGLPLFQWSSFRVVIFDEAHHALKNHPYSKLALSLRSWASSSSRELPRVLGLTASFSYAVSEAKTKVVLEQLCRDLGLTRTGTATPGELEAGGYSALGVKAEVRLPPATATPLGILPQDDRKSHEMATAFFRREEQGSGTRFAGAFMACVRSMERAVEEAEKRSPSQSFSPFASPMPPSGDLVLREWGPYAHKLAYRAGSSRKGAGGGRQSNRRIQRSPPKPDVHLLLAELEHWYEAARVLVISWEEREDDCATILDMFGCTGSPSYRTSEKKLADTWPSRVLQKIWAFWAEVPATFPRYEHLKDVLLEKYKHHGGAGSGSNGSSFRGIVFVRERVTTHVLAHVIHRDPITAGLFRTACLYATSKPATASLAVSEREAEGSIRSFREGRANLLLATAVVEEGMDIPAANCVVVYDAVEQIVSLIQRRGRAREQNSSFVVLSERVDRTTEDLEAVEQRQRECLEGFEPQHSNSTAEEVIGSDPGELDDTVSAGHEARQDEGVPEPCFASVIGRSLYAELNRSEESVDTGTVTDDAPSTAQKCLERAARGVLFDVQERHGLGTAMTANGTRIPPPGVLSAARDFAGQTNADLEESFRQDPATRQWVCTLSYESALRKLSASGEAVSGKKIARKLAAARLVAELIESTGGAKTDSAGVGTDEEASADATRTEQDDSASETSEMQSASADGCGTRVDLDRSEESSTECDTATSDTHLVEQWYLERAARGILLDVQERYGLGVVTTARGTPIPPPGVLSAAEDFAGQTNADLDQSFRQDPATRLWVCTLSYKSALRKVSASGEAVSGKKVARKLAAARLLAELIESTDPARMDSAGVGTEEEESAGGTWTEQDEIVAETSEKLSASTDGFGIEPDAANDDVYLAAQRDLERAARGVLLDVQERNGLAAAMTANGTRIPHPGVLSAARDFAGQTNADLEESFRQDPATRQWVCTLSYESALRKLSASGEAVSGKKIARKLAAARLVADLLAVVPA